MPKVFVSHATQDREFVQRQIVAVLRSHGIDTWYAEENIRTAEEWERAIVKGLEQCDWFLVVMSSRSAESPWVRAEVHWAMSHRPGRVVPVVMDDCNLVDFHLRMPCLQHIRMDFRGVTAQAREKLLAVFRPCDKEPLAGNLDVMVLRPDRIGWTRRSIFEEGAVPVSAVDRLCIDVRLNQPAFVYLLWINSEGVAEPVYPWKPGRWDERPSKEQRTTVLKLPDADPHVGWPIRGPAGLETVVVLAREERLSPTFDLQELLSNLPEENALEDPRAPVLFEAGFEEPSRSVLWNDAESVAKPNLALHAELIGRLRSYCEVLLGATFANSGD